MYKDIMDVIETVVESTDNLVCMFADDEQQATSIDQLLEQEMS